MITVTAERIIEQPQYQVLSSTVIVNGFDKLTPRAARAALEIAFPDSDSGRVWSPDMSYGYQVYAKSARKIELSSRGQSENTIYEYASNPLSDPTLNAKELKAALWGDAERGDAQYAFYHAWTSAHENIYDVFVTYDPITRVFAWATTGEPTNGKNIVGVYERKKNWQTGEVSVTWRPYMEGNWCVWVWQNLQGSQFTPSVLISHSNACLYSQPAWPYQLHHADKVSAEEAAEKLMKVFNVDRP